MDSKPYPVGRDAAWIRAEGKEVIFEELVDAPEDEGKVEHSRKRVEPAFHVQREVERGELVLARKMQTLGIQLPFQKGETVSTV